MDTDAVANNDIKKKRSARTTKKQIELIVSFLEENKILLKGKLEPSDIPQVKTKWDELGLLLNSSGKGPVKTTEQWKHVVAELQTNVKKRARLLYVEKTGTGGGPKQNKELSEMEERLLSLISKVCVEGAPIAEPGIYENKANSNENTSVIDNIEIEEIFVDASCNNEQTKEKTSKSSHNIKYSRNKNYKKKSNPNSISNMQTLSNLSDNLKEQSQALNNIAKSLDTLAAAINKIADKLDKL